MAIFLQSWRMGFCVAAFLCGIGCASLDREGAPPSGQASTPVPGPAPTPALAVASADLLRTGDKLTIEFSDIASAPAPLVQTIREDGTIVLPFNLSLVAAGKTRGQVHDEIYGLYVPKYYRRLTINLRTDERFYYVGGDVKMPSKQPYMGDLTVSKAIQSAGDFTDFGDRKRVLVIHVDGRQERVNVVKARKDPKLDVPIYPGDQVFVPRRLL